MTVRTALLMVFEYIKCAVHCIQCLNCQTRAGVIGKADGISGVRTASRGIVSVIWWALEQPPNPDSSNTECTFLTTVLIIVK